MRVAIIGLPRSGSTIVASVVNSIDGSLIIGEPHRLTSMPRPRGFEKRPIIFHTRYGRFDAYKGSSILDQIDEFALQHDTTMWGFKECQTFMTDALDLVVSEYSGRIDKVLDTIRHPLTNYSSLNALGHRPWEPESYNKAYASLVKYSMTNAIASPVVLELFRKNPVGVIESALGVSAQSAFPLKQYGGGGDTYASTAKKIMKEDTRPLWHDVDDVAESIETYDRLIGELNGTDNSYD